MNIKYKLRFGMLIFVCVLIVGAFYFLQPVKNVDGQTKDDVTLKNNISFNQYNGNNVNGLKKVYVWHGTSDLAEGRREMIHYSANVVQDTFKNGNTDVLTIEWLITEGDKFYKVIDMTINKNNVPHLNYGLDWTKAIDSYWSGKRRVIYEPVITVGAN